MKENHQRFDYPFKLRSAYSRLIDGGDNANKRMRNIFERRSEVFITPARNLNMSSGNADHLIVFSQRSLLDRDLPLLSAAQQGKDVSLL